MNAPETILRASLATACAILVCCSSSPTDLAGGTHVGNPEGVAAVRSFRAFTLHDRWCLSTYIPGGRSRLDPATIATGAVSTVIGPRLAKMAATSAAETTVVFDTVFQRDTSVHDRTLVKPETTLVKDTLFQTVYRRDTVNSVIDSVTSQVITLNTVTDSFYIKDTVFSNDTLTYQDTIVTVDTVVTKKSIVGSDTISSAALTAPAPLIIIAGSSSPEIANTVQFLDGVTSLRYQPDTGVIYEIPARVKIDSGSLIQLEQRVINVPATPGNVQTDSMKIIVSTGRTAATPAGIVISERYAELDGDGGLLTASPGHLPHLAFTATIAQPAGGTQSTTVIYTSGPDCNVSSVNSDVILSLAQNSSTASGDESVSYSIDTVTNSDTAMVSIQTDNPSDSIESIAATYTILRDADSSQAFDGRLLGVHQTTTFRIGQIHRVQVTVSPLSAATLGVQPVHALVEATIDLIDGTQARLLNGKIDLTQDLLSGTWVEGDQVKSVTLDSLGREVVGEIVWNIP